MITLSEGYLKSRLSHFMALAVGLAMAALLCSGVEAATIAGKVIDSAGNPVQRARVTLFTADLSTFFEARTNVLGDYTLDGVLEGSYSLGASANDLEYRQDSILLGAGTTLKDFTLGPEAHSGRWSTIGDTSPEFLDATDIAILTPAGKVFFCHDTDDPVLFDPATGQKSFPRGSGLEQGCMNGTVLQDGRIIMIGGQTPSGLGSFRNAIRWVKTYSSALDSWKRLEDLLNPTGRWYPGLARLADGSLLIMGGGTSPNAERTSTCERFDPATEKCTMTGSMLNPCEFPPSALLYTGKVLATWSPPQLYDPQVGTWRATGNFKQPNRGWPHHSDHSIVVLSDGRALVIGVRPGPDRNSVMGEVYDPVTESWSLASNPGLVRFQTEVVQLPDGRVLAAGGEATVTPVPIENTLGVVRRCDLYDPEKERWRRVADMQHFREYHAVTLLVPDGRVLTTGGTMIKFQVGPTTAAIEAFEPPYLFRGVRPKITGISSINLVRGGSISIEIEPLTAITSLVLLGAETTTHWVSGGIHRRLILPVEQAGKTVNAVLPENPNVLQLGYYLLFAMVDDIPSVARVVKVSEAARPILRGDSNRDSAQDISDALFSLNYLFREGREPDCLDAADANDDGTMDISDVIFLLLSLFGGSTPLPPDCAPDQTSDDLSCAATACR